LDHASSLAPLVRLLIFRVVLKTAMSAARIGVIFLASITVYEAVRGPQEAEEQRKHDPAWCLSPIGEGSITRAEDMDERTDNCCAVEQEAQCGGGYERVVDFEICSKQDTQVVLYEFKCYPDESEFPVPAVVAIVSAVALCCAIASACRFRYVHFQSPRVPEEEALFSHDECKSLTLSGSGTARQFSSRISETTKRLSRGSSKDDQLGASDNLPTLLPNEGDAALKGQTVGKPLEPVTSLQSVELTGNASLEPAGDIETHI